jgi:hypothetical protein
MMAAALSITEPGVYDLTAADYHADPIQGAGSLSSSGARKLLPPSCPARFAYDRANPPTPKAEYDLGHAAHQLVLGAGPELVVVDATDWRTNAAKTARTEAHAVGKVPLLAKDYLQVLAMGHALRDHPTASVLLHWTLGEPEQTLVWVDEETGVWCRCMLDWLPATPAPPRPGWRMIVPDYKTARSAAPEHLGRVVAEYGYHQQAAWNLAGIAALSLAEDPAFVFVAQEKTPPYLVTVFECDPEALAVAARRNRRALEIFRDCSEAGVWPGYSSDVEQISLPPWAIRSAEYEEMIPA